MFVSAIFQGKKRKYLLRNIYSCFWAEMENQGVMNREALNRPLETLDDNERDEGEKALGSLFRV